MCCSLCVNSKNAARRSLTSALVVKCHWLLHVSWSIASCYGMGVCFWMRCEHVNGAGSFSAIKTSPVTIVTSVPWERERDITENSPLWELLSWSPIGSRQSKWLANCHEACKSHANTDKLRGSIKCGARDNYVRNGYWTPLSWSSSEHGDLRDVSFPLSGNRGYVSNRRRSLSSFHETSQRILCYGNDIQSRRERGYEQPVQVTH